MKGNIEYRTLIWRGSKLIDGMDTEFRSFEQWVIFWRLLCFCFFFFNLLNSFNIHRFIEIHVKDRTRKKFQIGISIFFFSFSDG